MATETPSSDHASATTDELIVKKEKNEAIAEMINSLAKEDGEGKHDKPDDAEGKATPSNIEGETEEGEKKTEIEKEKSKDSSAVETPAEDNGKHEETEEAQTALVPSSDKKDEPDGIVEKSGDPVTLEENVAGDSKEKKELTSEAQIVAAEPEETTSVESVVEETPQQPEKECTETEEEEQPKTADIPEASTETIEKLRDEAVVVAVEANALAAEPKAEVVVEETEILEPNPEKEEKPVPVATEVLVETEEQGKESEDKQHDEIEQPNTVEIPESLAEVKEEPSDSMEKKTREVSVEELKEINKDEAGSAETEKADPVVTEVVENPKEPENQPLELKEEDQTNTGAIYELSAESIDDTTEEKTREVSVEELKEINNDAEPVVTEVVENPKEPENQPLELKEEDQTSTGAISELSAETIDDTTEEKTREVSIEELKDINKDEAGSAETEKADPVVTEVVENPKEPENQPLELKEEDQTNTGAISELSAETIDDTTEEKTREPVPEQEKVEPVVDEQSSKQEKEEETEPEPKTVISETVTESVDKPGDVVEVHPPKVSDTTKVVKESGNSVSELVPQKEEQQLDVSDKVEESSNDVDTKQEIVNETDTKIEGASDDTINDSISLKEEETSITENTPQVSSNREAQAFPEELLEPSHEATEKVIEEDEGNKNSSFAGVIEEAPKELAASTDEEAKTSIVIEREYSVPNGVEEKKETTTEVTATKVDEISADVKEPVRETLASKFQQQEDESAVKSGKVEDKKEGDDAMNTTSRDLPKEASTKTAQKQSNNIISKVKQSLVKAKKAIIGKSPSSKNHSSDTKGDIKVN